MLETTAGRPSPPPRFTDGGWSLPVRLDVDDTGQRAPSPTAVNVAMDGAGNALATWFQLDRSGPQQRLGRRKSRRVARGRRRFSIPEDAGAT